MSRKPILTILALACFMYAPAAFGQFPWGGGGGEDRGGRPAFGSRSEGRQGRGERMGGGNRGEGRSERMGGGRNEPRAEGRGEGRAEARTEARGEGRSERMGGGRGEWMGGMGGGRMGGMGGGRGEGGDDRLARLKSFLQGMDADGDGVVRENEVPEEYRRMFGFIAARVGQDPAQGISIQQLEATMEGASGQSDGEGNQDKNQDEKPLVPGFGNDSQACQVPGFGPSDEPSQTASTDRQRDRQRSQSRDSNDPAAHAEPSDNAAPPENQKAADEDHPAQYRLRSAQDRLPKGLPDWFTARDADKDGQVSMAEFAQTWSDAKVEEFFRYDANRDGVITPEECLKVGGAGQSKAAAPPPAAAAPPAAAPNESQPTNQNGNGKSSGSQAKPWWMP